jgi:hypothetical protein
MDRSCVDVVDAGRCMWMLFPSRGMVFWPAGSVRAGAVDRFTGTEDEALVDRLADHAALGGPEQTYFRARLARVRGDLATARRLVGEALEKLPGHAGFLAFARETETPLPPRAAAVLATRRLPES